MVGYVTAAAAPVPGRPALTFVLKVLLIPWLLHRVIDRLNVRWDVETLINIPTTMLIGIVRGDLRLQPGAADLAAVVDAGQRHAGHRAGLRAAVVPDDDHARQGGAAGDRLPGDGERRCSSPPPRATYGMPMVVELGIALDVLIGVLILGVFMFQIREQFDSLDIRHLEKLKED
ncbi:MAG: hypothetical protein MZV65_27920 [Chromatiales bacterium]|nr:hypothetical protein [Chromatiales bacterium]